MLKKNKDRRNKQLWIRIRYILINHYITDFLTLLKRFMFLFYNPCCLLLFFVCSVLDILWSNSELAEIFMFSEIKHNNKINWVYQIYRSLCSFSSCVFLIAIYSKNSFNFFFGLPGILLPALVFLISYDFCQSSFIILEMSRHILYVSGLCSSQFLIIMYYLITFYYYVLNVVYIPLGYTYDLFHLLL